MRAILSALLLGTLVASVPAHALSTATTEAAAVAAGAPGTFTFTVGGWGDGGTVTGSFAGTDLDLDGQLSSFDGEVTAFSMSYSGGALIAAFGLGLGNLFGLVYDLDGGVLGDGILLDVEGIGAADATHLFALGPGPVAVCSGTALCGIIDAPGIAVPEPTALALLFAAGAAMAGLRRRRHF